MRRASQAQLAERRAADAAAEGRRGELRPAGRRGGAVGAVKAAGARGAGRGRRLSPSRDLLVVSRAVVESRVLVSVLYSYARSSRSSTARV